MSMDLLILGAGGMIALIAAGIVAILSPGGAVSLVAAGALAMLGVLEFSFARAIFDLGTNGRTEWFVNSLALSLPVSTLWVLLSVMLGRTRGARGIGAWRFYLYFQLLLSAAAAAYALLRAHHRPEASAGSRVFHLQGVEWAILAAILLNLILMAAKFEATHLSLPQRRRETFRPALLGVLGCSGLLSYLIFSMLATGRVDVGDIGASAAPASLLSFLLAASLIRGRIGEAHAPEDRLPATATTSLLLAAGYVAWTAVLLWLTRSAGMRLAEGLLWITIGAAVAVIAALAVSNRLRRRLDLFLDPVWYEPRAVRRLSKNASHPFDGATSIEDLCRLIPENARTVADVDPVTLFLADPVERCFRAVGSTLEPPPAVLIPDREPLPMELRRARRPIRLTGRSDDLEYVGIYVENASQIEACRAVCAIPILGDEGLIGFLLCGARGGTRQVHGEELVLLNLASREYAERVERLQREGAARSREL